LINQNSDEVDPSYLGLPPGVSRKGLPHCDEYSPNFETPCTAKGSLVKTEIGKRMLTEASIDLFKHVKKLAPLFAPNQASSYSNLAFEILGLVLSRVANQTYETYIDEAIFKPLNMSTSTFSKPADSAGVIPAGPHYWDVEEG
jgi:CubicO group peptidase (beta-lactamase class C family)